MVGGKRHTEREKRWGVLCVSLEKWVKLSFLTSRSLFISSQPVSSTVIWWLHWWRQRWERGEKQTWNPPFRSQTFTSGDKTKTLLVPLFKMNGRVSLSGWTKRGLQQWKWDKTKKKSAEIRVFHPPLCLFQSTWMPEPMQETAWSSGGRAAGGQPAVSLWVALDRSVHLEESYELH